MSGSDICIPMSLTLSVASEVEYNSPILVTFNNPTPSERNWIGIYKESDESLAGDLLWAGMCGDQESYYADDPCPAQTNGSIAFSGDGPDQSWYEEWSLSSGNYNVCVFHDVNGKPYYDDPHVCKSFVIVN